MDTFEQLPYSLAKATYLYGYKMPTDVQEEAIPLIRDRKSIIIQAPTGTGKSAAFILGSALVAQSGSPNLQIMVLSPTRELCQQTSEVFKLLSGLKVALVVTQIDQFNYFKQSYQVVVTTPERFSKLYRPSVRCVVFDEVDSMLSEKQELLRKIAIQCVETQCVLCSATFSRENLELCGEFFKVDRVLNVRPEVRRPVNTHYYHVCEAADRPQALLALLQTFSFGECVVFCDRRHSVEETCALLRRAKFGARQLHAGIAQSERIETLRAFASGEFRVLVSTDLFGRGMDVRQVNLVVLYDAPQNCEQYEHRSGRSGRFGRRGVVVSLVAEAEEHSLKECWGELGITGEAI